MKISCQVRISNALGIHTRPATAIVQMLQNCKSAVSFTHRKQTINAKSILSILMLAAQKNSKIVIEAEGDDAEDIVKRLVDLFDRKFGEE